MSANIYEDRQILPDGSKDIRCIICPTGCLVHIENVSGELIIEGHSCKKGEEYAREEFIAPKRILTTTIRVGKWIPAISTC